VIDLPRRLIVRQHDARDGRHQVAESFAPGSCVPIGNETIAVDDILPQAD